MCVHCYVPDNATWYSSGAKGGTGEPGIPILGAVSPFCPIWVSQTQRELTSQVKETRQMSWLDTYTPYESWRRHCTGTALQMGMNWFRILQTVHCSKIISLIPFLQACTHRLQAQSDYRHYYYHFWFFFYFFIFLFDRPSFFTELGRVYKSELLKNVEQNRPEALRIFFTSVMTGLEKLWFY